MIAIPKAPKVLDRKYKVLVQMRDSISICIEGGWSNSKIITIRKICPGPGNTISIDGVRSISVSSNLYNNF